jgi:para-aminobenzoate synthetase component 1
MSASHDLQIRPLPYRADGCTLFAAVRQLPGAVFLDSGAARGLGGRFDIIAADPDSTLGLRLPPQPTAAQVEDFFNKLTVIHEQSAVDGPATGLPFSGGLIGHIGYDACATLHGPAAVSPAVGHGAMPSARADYYRWAILQDHNTRESCLVAEPGVAASCLDRVMALLAAPPPAPAPFALLQPFRANLESGRYATAFERLQAYIRAGDCYQANLARRFAASFDGDPFTAYRQLREVAGGAFSAYLEETPGQALLCLSPERFLAADRGEVLTQPIKGTRPRHPDPGQDRRIAHELQHSSKDRAENLMIVDLLRNDIGRNCRIGSVQVETLFELRSYPGVHHLVSSVRGQLAPGKSVLQLLRDSLPGGSITGAPKRRAMEIIAELEPDSRQAYCGSVFYLSRNGRMDSNIAIRSLVADRGALLCWGGGGIVADSQCEQEMQETLDKVGPLMQTLEREALKTPVDAAPQ